MKEGNKREGGGGAERKVKKVEGEGRSLEKLVKGLSLKEKVEVKKEGRSLKKKVRVKVRSLSLKERAEELALKQGREVEVVLVEEEHSLKHKEEEQSLISTSTWQRFEEVIERSFDRTFDDAKADFALSLQKKGEELSSKWKMETEVEEMVARSVERTFDNAKADFAHSLKQWGDELSLKWRKQVEEKAVKRAAVKDQSLKQQQGPSFVSTRQKVQQRRSRSLQKILDDARDEFPWPDVSDIRAELGPVPRLPYAQSSKTMEVLAVTYCGAALRLANVRFGDIIDAGMPGVRLDYHKTDGRHSLKWFERRNHYRKRRHSLVVEVGDDYDRS